MKILVKVGGAQLDAPAARAAFADSVARASSRSGGRHELTVVHGGGDQIRALSRRLGIEDEYRDGLRVTDAATAEVALQVLGGQVNRELTAALHHAGVNAVGLTGADGGLFAARKYRPRGEDLGFVGEIHRIDARLVHALHAQTFTPVVATIAPLATELGAAGAETEAPGPFYNINADQAVAPLARAFGCDAVLFLTDVPAVLDAAGHPIAHLDDARCEQLRSDGTLRGGMIPKVEAARAARRALGPGAIVKIAPAAGRDAIRDALRDGVGTAFVAASDSGGAANA